MSNIFTIPPKVIRSGQSSWLFSDRADHAVVTFVSTGIDGHVFSNSKRHLTFIVCQPRKTIFSCCFLFVPFSVYMYIFICICICIYIKTYIHMYIFIFLYICTYIYIFIVLYIYCRFKSKTENGTPGLFP
jgi:hypothetical protein